MLSATFLYWIKINSYTNWVFLFISCIFMYLEMKTKERRWKNTMKRKNIWHLWRLFPSQQNTLQVDVMTAALNQNSVIAAIVFQSQTAVTVYQWQTAVTMSVEKSYELQGNPSPLYFLYDCEGTGGSIYKDDFVEIAAVLQPLANNVETHLEKSFHSLVNMSGRIAAPGRKNVLE